MRWAVARVAIWETEYYTREDCRWIPLFPELLPYLREVFEKAKPGSKYVINQRHPDILAEFQRLVESPDLNLKVPA